MPYKLIKPTILFLHSKFATSTACMRTSSYHTQTHTGNKNLYNKQPPFLIFIIFEREHQFGNLYTNEMHKYLLLLLCVCFNRRRRTIHIDKRIRSETFTISALISNSNTNSLYNHALLQKFLSIVTYNDEMGTQHVNERLPRNVWLKVDNEFVYKYRTNAKNW